MEYNVGDIVKAKVTMGQLVKGKRYKIMYSDRINQMCRLHIKIEGAEKTKPVPGSCTWGWLDKCVELERRAS